MVRSALPEVIAEKRQAPDEFGPWDSDEDEFGSWVNKRSPHHTEAQIAAKNAAAGNAGSGNTGSGNTGFGNGRNGNGNNGAGSGNTPSCNNNQKR
jgi:hypothetical protein